MISVIVPIHNESANLEELIDRLLAACRRLPAAFEILLIDDGSTDDSAAIIASAVRSHPGEITAVVLEGNFGQHAAILAGFSLAQGEAIVTIDADLQNPPEEIPSLAQKMLDGYDLVATTRACRQDGSFRRVASWFINRLTSLATGVPMTDCGCMLRAYRSGVAKNVLEADVARPFIPVLAMRYARRSCEIPVRHQARQAGRSKYSLVKLLRLGYDLARSLQRPARRAPGPDHRFVIRSILGSRAIRHSAVELP